VCARGGGGVGPFSMKVLSALKERAHRQFYQFWRNILRSRCAPVSTEGQAKSKFTFLDIVSGFKLKLFLVPKILSLFIN
jgi:hypothetical protein